MSQIFSLSLLGYISIIPSTFLQAQKAVRAIYYSNTLFSVVKIVSLFTGALIWGLWGVLIARTLYEYAGLGILWWFTKDRKLTTNNAT